VRYIERLTKREGAREKEREILKERERERERFDPRVSLIQFSCFTSGGVSPLIGAVIGGSM
jgi:hypothetical protein